MSLLPWAHIARGHDGLRSTSGTSPRALRIGDLVYQHPNVDAWRLRVPALVSCHHPQPLVITRNPRDASRSTSLLNSIALRFALATPRARLRIGLVDPYDGASALDALNSRALADAKLVTFRRPNTIVDWLSEDIHQTTLLVVYHALLEDEAADDDECTFGFRYSEMTTLVKYLASPECKALTLLAVDPSDPHHPLMIGLQDGSLRSTHVHLATDAAALHSSFDGSPHPVFEPDTSPPPDIARDLIARAGLL